MKRLAARPERGSPITLGFFHRTGDALQKTPVFGHSEEIFDLVALAPAHQRIPAEAAVGSYQDLHQSGSASLTL
jgi:hypothetical protein